MLFYALRLRPKAECHFHFSP